MSEERALAMLREMANMQDSHNKQVHEQWRTQGYEYYRAIWVECAEMLDHFGWKWWKKQAPDLQQVKLELVDIWHFALSEMLRADNLSDNIALQLQAAVNPASVDECADPVQFRLAIEDLAASSLVSKSFAVEPFMRAMQTLPMTYAELYSMYIGKNVLNRFRQEHGYKDGSYEKVWSGREDNEHLVEVMEQLMAQDDAGDGLQDKLYAGLLARYPSS